MVLSTLREWLLHHYVANYCRSLGAARIFRRCYLIDALGIDSKALATAHVPQESEQANSSAAPAAVRSGRGRKKVAARSVPPALEPVVSLGRWLDTEYEGKAATFYGLVLQAGSSTRSDAKRARKEAPVEESGGRNGSTRKSIQGLQAKSLEVPKESGIVQASWLECSANVLEAIDPSPAIFLLNPFGPTLFSYDDLLPLYQRTAPTELCLLVPHKQVELRLRAALKSSAHASSLTALLRSDRWKTFSLEDENEATRVGVNGRGGEIEEVIDGIITLFIASMQRHFLFPVQRISLPVVTRPALVEPVPYTLIFATRRQDSLFTMNDAVCLYSRQIYEQSPRGVLGEAWFEAQLHERMQKEREELYRRILQQGRAQRIRRWPDLRQSLLLANFGRYTIQEYDEMILKIVFNKEVRCEWRRKSLETEEQRVPGSDDTLLW